MRGASSPFHFCLSILLPPPRSLLASVSFWPLLIIESVAHVSQDVLFTHELLVNVSVNSKPNHPPPERPPGFSHSGCPWGRGFAPLSCPEVLNQNKNSTILGKARFLLCHLNKRVAALFICLYPGVYICYKQAVATDI